MQYRTLSESSLRMRARRYGYSVRKSRAVESADQSGGYMLVDVRRDACVLGRNFDASLEDLSFFLAGD
jgi:hypothetical protein